MIFIDYDKDLKSTKTSDILNELSESDYHILDDLETEAIGLIESYIGGSYDTNMIFSGDYSYPYIKRIVKDFILLYLYERVENAPPEYVVEKTDKHLEWLSKVSKNQLSTNLPRKNEETDGKTASMGYDTGFKFI